MSPDFIPISGTERLWTAVPVLEIRSVPPSAGSEIIFGVIENSASVTATLAPGADAPDADPLRKPNVASAKAATATANANQPRTDFSSRAMTAMLTRSQTC